LSPQQVTLPSVLTATAQVEVAPALTDVTTPNAAASGTLVGGEEAGPSFRS
jgi:hypothetical protein